MDVDVEARERIAVGDLRGAADVYRAHLATTPDPEIRLQFARILHIVDHAAQRVELERALEEFLAAGKPRRAAVAASRLGVFYMTGIGNRVVARPWFARAWRLLEGEGDCLERGLVAVAEIGCNVDDPGVLRERAETALAIARRLANTQLEAKALADSGLALVELGALRDGFERLDEAISIVTSGAMSDRVTTAQTCCALFSACAHAGDLARAESWSALLRERGLIGPTGVKTIAGHCDSVYGGLLCRMGRWGEAEEVLERASETARVTTFAGQLHAASALAELRVLQGRLDDAEALLIGKDDHLEALVPMAHLHLARGDHDLAAATARRGLRLLGGETVRAVSLLAALVEAELGRGDVAAATAASVELDKRAATSGLPALLAEAAIARARLAGDPAQAAFELESALEVVAGVDLPLIRARVHTELAWLRASSDPAAARVDARAALAIYARLDAALPPEQAHRLQDLAVVSRPRGADVAVLAAAEHGWIVRRDRASHQLRDAKGLRYLAELLAKPDVDHHVFDLVALTDPPDEDARRDRGDAGAMLDATAKASYRRRIEALRDRISDREDRGDTDGAIALQHELEVLARELARAVGLGGRDRRAASGAEKARLNVTRAVRAAIERIAEADPVAGQALDAAIRTGMYCCYRPDAGAAVAWRAEIAE